MIRARKGFEEMIDIAKALSKDAFHKLSDTRIKIVGNPSDTCDVLSKILRTKFKSDTLKHVLKLSSIKNITKRLDEMVATKEGIIELQKHISQMETIEKDQAERLLPIDIVLNPAEEDMPKLYEDFKYAVKYDNKGWANNASSHIVSLVNNCIVYTGWGMNTDKQVVEDKSVQFLSYKYGLKSGCKLTLEQIKNQEKQKFLYRDTSSIPYNKDPVSLNKILETINFLESNESEAQKVFSAVLTLKQQFIDVENLVFDFLESVCSNQTLTGENSSEGDIVMEN